MASTHSHSDGIVEACSPCGTDQPHDVSLELLTEATEGKNTEFSREPYRVAECTVCGATTQTRMNDA